MKVSELFEVLKISRLPCIDEAKINPFQIAEKWFDSQYEDFGMPLKLRKESDGGFLFMTKASHGDISKGKDTAIRVSPEGDIMEISTLRFNKAKN